MHRFKNLSKNKTTSMKQLQQVRKWHEKYKVPIMPIPNAPEFERQKLRYDLLLEEVKELGNELKTDPALVNLARLAKELCDVLYVTYGTALEFGLQGVLEKCFDEVHRSNMSKGTDGKPVFRHDGKVMKGEDYEPADLSFVG